MENDIAYNLVWKSNTYKQMQRLFYYTNRAEPVPIINNTYEALISLNDIKKDSLHFESLEISLLDGIPSKKCTISYSVNLSSNIGNLKFTLLDILN
jgi:hypothetical protein